MTQKMWGGRRPGSFVTRWRLVRIISGRRQGKGSPQSSIQPDKVHISFEEAQTVFLDENARLIDDPDHSAEEERFVL